MWARPAAAAPSAPLAPAPTPAAADVARTLLRYEHVLDPRTRAGRRPPGGRHHVLPTDHLVGCCTAFFIANHSTLPMPASGGAAARDAARQRRRCVCPAAAGVHGADGALLGGRPRGAAVVRGDCAAAEVRSALAAALCPVSATAPSSEALSSAPPPSAPHAAAGSCCRAYWRPSTRRQERAWAAPSAQRHHRRARASSMRRGRPPSRRLPDAWCHCLQSRAFVAGNAEADVQAGSCRRGLRSEWPSNCARWQCERAAGRAGEGARACQRP